jgi:2-dehydropantoate 2-reductase
MGAGAVGGYFGAKLAAAGHEVSFIARGAHLAALKRHGLSIESYAGNFLVDGCVFTDDPAKIGTVDLVLFCVKSYDTPRAIEIIRPLVGPQTSILSLQNGIDNPDQIASIWGSAQTLIGVVYIGAAVLRPGVIQHTAGGRIVFGIVEGGDSIRALNVQRTLSAAGIPCDFSADIRQAQWRKLLWNAPFCALSCLARATVKDILDSDSLRQLAIDCMAEVRQAAEITGIFLEGSAIDETLAFSQGLGGFKPSMLQDLEAEKPLEYQAFNGLVADLLARAGRSATVNRVFTQLLTHIDHTIRCR